MTKRASVEQFPAQSHLGLVGASRSGRKLGILMFAQPKGIHRLHRWIRRLKGTLPEETDLRGAAVSG